MPLFDYLCKSCDNVFEHFTRPGERVTCPSCGNADVEKQLSMFRVGLPRPTPAQKQRALMRRAGWIPVKQTPKRSR